MKIDKDILQRYASGACSEAEKQLVEAWLEEYRREDAFSIDELDASVRALDKQMAKRVARKPTWRWVAAAAVLIAASFAVPRFLAKETTPTALVLEEIKAPTSSNAVVVLDNNTTYNLDSLQLGDTLRAKDYVITKLPTGELHYRKTTAEDVIVYNTLRTNTGGIAQVQLSDGSLVWLNANSELVYPIAFAPGRREVLLRGEGYFEVARKESAAGREPFYVRSEQQTIKVLGTKFNANFRTGSEIALLEGKVALSNQGSALENSPTDNNFAITMLPDQVYDGKGLRAVADIHRYIDWKEGYFDLNDVRLDKLAAKLADWYGVPVEVERDVAHYRLFGRISRQKNLREVLDLLTEVSPVSYHQGDKRIQITRTNK